MTMTWGKTEMKPKVGDKVYHRNLALSGIVIDDRTFDAYSILVEFEDGETREVSTHLLDPR